MDTTESTESRPRPRCNYAAILISCLMVAALVVIGIGVSLSSNGPTANVQVATESTQDCTKPTGKVGDLCATATHEHGATVTRTYVTQRYTNGGGLYAYLQDTTVQLNYGDTPTLDKLCSAATVASMTPDHPDYTYQRQIIERDYCGDAQKAKDAGNSTECFYTLNDVFANAPLVFTIENINEACAVPVQPKGKSALVQTSPNSNLLNGIPWYDADADPNQTSYVPAA